MRKLPRRLPSNSPSLAWVAFAILLLAVGGGLAGLYTHRQNQESAKLQLIEELKREVAVTRERAASYKRGIDSWVRADNLKLEMQRHELDLHAVVPESRVLIAATPAPRQAAESETLPPASPPSASPAAPSVMAVLGRP